MLQLEKEVVDILCVLARSQVSVPGLNLELAQTPLEPWWLSGSPTPPPSSIPGCHSIYIVQ